MSQKKVVQIRIDEEEKDLWESFVDDSDDFSTISKLIKQTVGKFVRGDFIEVKLDWDELNSRSQEIIKECNEKQQKLLQFFLGGKCSQCGYDENQIVLGVYYKNNNDQFVPFRVRDTRDYSWEKVHKNIERYKVLCRSCVRTLYSETG